jgi:hypothetical protein
MKPVGPRACLLHDWCDQQGNPTGRHGDPRRELPGHDWLQLWFGLYPLAEPPAVQALTLAVMLLPEGLGSGPINRLEAALSA